MLQASRPTKHRTGIGVSAAATTLVLALGLPAAPGQTRPASQPPSLGEPVMIADAGFEYPESFIHDEVDDVYLVSNVSPDSLGFPNAIDNNGFISRIYPDGTVAELKWIAGGVGGVTLNSPKGLALVGDVLYVSDIDSVRMFDRVTGAPLGQVPVPYEPFVTWLNDVAAGLRGEVYASDSGIGAACSPPEVLCPSGTDAIYRIGQDGTLTVVAQDPGLEGPNGLVALGRSLFYVPVWGTRVYWRRPFGKLRPVAQLGGTFLDGIVRLGDGSLLISSWIPPAIHWVDPARRRAAVIKTFTIVDPANPFVNEVPADIGYDRTRSRLLVPFTVFNKVGIYPVQSACRRPRHTGGH